jgi:peptide/nickel transport system substrate-binding protein
MVFGFDPDVKPLPFDPAQAKKLLAEAGFPQGIELSLNTYTGSIVNMEQVAQAIQGYLANVGIRTKVRHFADVGQYLAAFRGGKLDGITMASWGYNSVFDTDAIYYIHFKKGEPYAYNTSPDMDAMLDEARATVDPKKRQQLYSKLQQLIVEQAYWGTLYAQFTIEAVSNKLNYEASGDEIMRVYSATWKQ